MSSDILEIQEKLLDTDRMLAQLRASAVNAVGSAAFILEYQSVERRRDKLVRLLQTAATAAGREICEYHFDPIGGHLTAAGLSEALGGFQRLLGVAYEAVSRGPRQSAHVSGEATRATDLDFGYTMAGSIAFVFTVAVEPDLLGDDFLTDTFRQVFAASHASGAEGIRRIAAAMGAAPVRELYKWAHAHARHQLAAEIVYKPQRKARQKIELQPDDFWRLVEAIGETSDEKTEEIIVGGQLVGADVTTRRFHLELDDGTDIRGDLGAAVGPTQQVVLNVSYTARILKRTIVHYATDREQVSYTLAALTRLGQSPADSPRP